MKYLENSDFAIYLLGFNFEDRFSEKKDSYLVLISEKHLRRSFLEFFLDLSVTNFQTFCQILTCSQLLKWIYLILLK